MKKERGIIGAGILLFCVFVLIAILTFHQSNQMIEKGYLTSEGNAAQNFAVLTAANIHLSNNDVANLKEMSYSELQDAKQNKELRTMMSNPSFTNKVDYAYIMVHLPEDEVKYSVTEENKELFDAEIGTPLDILWLLDVTVSEEKQSESDESETSIDDIYQRYSYFIQEDKAILSDTPTYIFNASEWGDHICGYAPLYSNEGDYIGAVGVELQTEDYNAYKQKAMNALALLLGIATFTLILLFIFLYLKYRRLQYDKIYSDALTGIHNRSYFNNRFVKYLNQIKKSDYYMALLIADIDWFKKINDTFGHDVGDQALIEISTLLVETFGRDHVVRFGGEEFVVGLWIKQETELANQLDKLYHRIAETKFCNQQIDISISLGGSILQCKDVSGWTISSMLKAADYKLYEAKEGGRKQYLVTEFDSEKNYEKK